MTLKICKRYFRPLGCFGKYGLCLLCS